MVQEQIDPAASIAPIPAEDLTRQYEEIKGEIEEAIERVLPSGRYTLGRELAAFEEEFAAYCGARYAIGVSNGTDALHLALAACVIGQGKGRTGARTLVLPSVGSSHSLADNRHSLHSGR
jgi:dTDP-4-amino-4,6-dideoxygalactose transaminase